MKLKYLSGNSITLKYVIHLFHINNIKFSEQN